MNSNEKYIKEKAIKEIKIKKMLDKLVAEGIIKRWYLDNYSAWHGVPYILTNNNEEIALAKEFLYLGASGISTIFDLDSVSYAKNKVLKAIQIGYYE